jgi:hypothetical protein
MPRLMSIDRDPGGIVNRSWVAQVDRRSTWVAQPQTSWARSSETIECRSKDACRDRDPGRLKTGNRGHPRTTAATPRNPARLHPGL